MNNELTKSDIEKMQEEIEYRKITVRQELLEHVKTARAHGDLSENFEYKAAKKEKNANESRIRFLERMIKTAVIVSDESPDDEVGINKEVTVEFCDDHSEETYCIVTTMRENSLKGLISTESPVGKALMGHKVNDKVTVCVNDKVSYDLIIKKIDIMKEDVGLNKF
ncbi:MAG: GreA/GreB family elongation factor [Lachnospiraceae bacterium]